MRQRIKKLLFCLTICILAGFELQGCGKNEYSAKEVQTGLGSAVLADILDYISITQGSSEKFISNAVLELSTIDPMTVGEYEGDSPGGRRFVSFSQFPYYEEDNYVSEELFAILKEEYLKLDWQSEFETGNLNEYDFYKEKYRELITNQKPFYDCETGEELFLKDYSAINIPDMDSYDSAMEMYQYYLFDMDQDNMPELCIEGMTCIAIFKYDRDNDSFLMWKAYEQTSYYGLLGSRTAYFQNPGLASGEYNTFYKLDENGKEIYMVTFTIGYYIDSQTDDRNEAYMVAFPYYVDKDQHIELSEEIKRQGFLCTENQEYYFRITKEQFDEITKDYYLAIEQAPEKLKPITYTYEELKGEQPF